MSTAATNADTRAEGLPTLFGQPTGLFMLFFAEMWERFSYYGMKALLLLYMVKGFLGYNDNQAYEVYAAYTALVYATPFIGGAIADHLLGTRKAVILGGALMAAGHLIMGIENETAFFMALALLIVGNGFFKPNISTIVGSLYPDGDERRDGGFTIFYMGINLGAAMSPLLCGYVGETYGWHYGFGLATIGMLVGLAVFVAPAGLTRLLILLGAISTAGSMVYLNMDKVIYVLAPNAFVALALVAAGVIAFVAIGKAGLPEWAGQPADPEAPKRPLLGPLSVEWTIYLGALVTVPVLAFIVKGGAVATVLLSVMGVGALAFLIFEAARATSIERDRIIVILVLVFFSTLFWAFFEQAGSSMSLFTDRNVDRVVETQVITADQVGQTVEVQLTQGLTGRTFGDEVVTLDWVEARLKNLETTVMWPVSEDDVGMTAAGDQIATSQFLAANPIYILVFGLIFSWLWTTLGKINLDPSPSVKFSLGLMQLGLGFGALWYGTQNADSFGMVSMSWLLLAYLLHTTGELCLSPVGLSMVTKLSPKRIVAAVMGAWFMSSAFANYLSGAIAKLTGISGEGGEEAVLPPPIETLDVYADVFGPLGVIAIGAGLVLLVISPLLTKLMHLDELDDDGASAAGH